MTPQTGIVWKTSPADMAVEVEKFGKQLLQAVFRIAEQWTKRLLAEMKKTHPWKNQSGDAERLLFGRVFRLAAGAVIVMGHGVDYGIHLERKNAGKYAVIMPTIQRNQAAVMASLQQLVRG